MGPTVGISFSDGVAARVHATPFYTWYATRGFKTGAMPPQKIGSRVMYPWIFFFCLFQHGGNMSPIWRPLTDVSGHYVDKVVDMISVQSFAAKIRYLNLP
jgi:hypothetical protein